MSKRKVICRFCGKQNEQRESFKVTIKNRNEYYCNEEHYEELLLSKKNREKVLEMCCEIFDCRIDKDTLFLKELKDVLEDSNIETLKICIEDNIIDLDVALSKEFKSIAYKIKYFFAIVKRNLIKAEEIQKATKNENILTTNNEFYNYKFKPRKQKVTWLEKMNGGK